MSKILFIDDEPLPNRRARAALESRGYEVTFCTNALEGLRLMIEGQDWSAVVLDMMMPVPEEWQAEVIDAVTGIKLLAEARAALIKSGTPVLVFTNRRTDLLVEKLEALDFPKHLLGRLEKDVLSPADFAQRVFELAGAARRGQPLGSGTWLP